MGDVAAPSVARRLGVTILVPLAVLLADRIPLPGVPSDLLIGGPGFKLTLFELGVTPIILAYVLVEIVALLVPRLDRLRHGGPQARAKLDLVARLLMLLFAASQAYAFAHYLRSLTMPGSSEVNVPFVVASQVAAVAVLYLAARFVTMRGLVNGLLLFMAVFVVRALIEQVQSAIVVEQAAGELGGPASLRLGVGVALPIVASVLAFGGVTFGAGANGTRTQSPYRKGSGRHRLQAWVPVPASSIYPFAASISILMLPLTLRHFGIKLPAAPDLQSSMFTFAVVVLVLGLVFSFLLQRPLAVARVMKQIGMAAPEDEANAATAILRALLPTFLFLGCLVLARRILSSPDAQRVGIETPLVVAVTLDLVASIRTLAADPGRVAVWQERRPYAATAICAALRAQDIDAWARGLHSLGLLSFFAPYAPAEITVPAPDAKRAHELVERWFVEDRSEDSADVPAAVPLDESPEPDPAKARKRTLTRPAPLAITAALGGAALFLPTRRAPGFVPAATLELTAVDDRANPLAKPLAALASVPKDMDIIMEDAPVGVDEDGSTRHSRITFVRAHRRPGESAAQTRARLLRFLRKFPVPAGDHFAVEDVADELPDGDNRSRAGARSVLLGGPPLLTNTDIADAMAVPAATPGRPMELGQHNCALYIKFTDAGSKRFFEATKRLVKRRFAIVVNGVVESQPIVQTPIRGGHVSIALGPGYTDSCAEARRLAAALRSKQPARVR